MIFVWASFIVFIVKIRCFMQYFRETLFRWYSSTQSIMCGGGVSGGISVGVFNCTLHQPYNTLSHQSHMLTNFYQCQCTIIRQHNKKKKGPNRWHFSAFALYKQYRRVFFFQFSRRIGRYICPIHHPNSTPLESISWNITVIPRMLDSSSTGEPDQ